MNVCRAVRWQRHFLMPRHEVPFRRNAREFVCYHPSRRGYRERRIEEQAERGKEEKSRLVGSLQVHLTDTELLRSLSVVYEHARHGLQNFLIVEESEVTNGNSEMLPPDFPWHRADIWRGTGEIRLSNSIMKHLERLKNEPLELSVPRCSRNTSLRRALSLETSKQMRVLAQGFFLKPVTSDITIKFHAIIAEQRVPSSVARIIVHALCYTVDGATTVSHWKNPRFLCSIVGSNDLINLRCFSARKVGHDR